MLTFFFIVVAALVLVTLVRTVMSAFALYQGNELNPSTFLGEVRRIGYQGIGITYEVVKILCLGTFVLQMIGVIFSLAAHAAPLVAWITAFTFCIRVMPYVGEVLWDVTDALETGISKAYHAGKAWCTTTFFPSAMEEPLPA